MKLALVDIDGVLNHKWTPFNQKVDPKCVARLNTIIDSHACWIVVISAQRIGKTLAQVRKLLLELGIRGRLAGVTPEIGGYGGRDKEIAAWIENYGQHRMVLIDDAESQAYKDIQVQPDWENGGLQDKHIKQANEILNR